MRRGAVVRVKFNKPADYYFSDSKNLYIPAAMAAPTNGPIMNTHTHEIGSALPDIAAAIAGPILLAGTHKL